MRGPRHKCFNQQLQWIAAAVKDNVITHYLLGIPVEPKIEIKSTVATQTDQAVETQTDPPMIKRNDAFYGIEEFERLYGSLD